MEGLDNLNGGQEGNRTREAKMARGRLVGRRQVQSSCPRLRNTCMGRVEENHASEGSEEDLEELGNEGRGGRESF